MHGSISWGSDLKLWAEKKKKNKNLLWYPKLIYVKLGVNLNLFETFF